MQVGDVSVIALSDGINQRTVDQQSQLLHGNRQRIDDLLANAYPDGKLESTVNAFLVHAEAKLILVDTGNGSLGSPSMGRVIGNLRAAGYEPEQIDEIYLTHMHGDHVGGLLAGTERAFSNATVYASKREADYWLSDANRDAAPAAAKRTFQAVRTALMPYIHAGKFKIFEENALLSAGVRAEPLFGHTPGHTAYLVESKGVTMVLWGDIVHVAAVQFVDPAVTIAYDTDETAAADARWRILAAAAKNKWWVGGAHLAFPGIGRVHDGEDGGYVFVPLELPANK
ncbi:MAG: MBL fold metallo-hydrolase [Veillonellaceae bacterium]|nr:MBL fold metallo-hydrolase [Veillonellaceae bacterium]